MRDLDVCKRCGTEIKYGTYCAQCLLDGLHGKFKFNWYSGERGRHGDRRTHIRR